MKIQPNSHSKESWICISTGEDVLKQKDSKLQSAGRQHREAEELPTIRDVTVEETVLLFFSTKLPAEYLFEERLISSHSSLIINQSRKHDKQVQWEIRTQHRKYIRTVRGKGCCWRMQQNQSNTYCCPNGQSHSTQRL